MFSDSSSFKVALLLITPLITLLIGSAVPVTAQTQDVPEIKVLWFQWGPCFELRDTLAPMYEEAFVNVTCVPLTEWHSTIFRDDFRSSSPGVWDIVVLDSQWIGEAVTGDHLVELTEFVNARLDTLDYFEGPFKAYSEYPPNSNRLFGVPFFADVQFLVYRKDIWEQLGVKDVFGFDDPETDSGLLQVARRINQGDFNAYGYGTIWCTDCPGAFDQGATVWNQMAWSYGGEIWNSATFQIDGVLQSEQNVRSLEVARELVLQGPPNALDLDFGDIPAGLCDGTLAMGSIWAAFGPAFTADNCLYRDQLGFTVVPGQSTHFLSLGGMGMHVSNYISAEKAAIAEDFLQWSQTQRIQRVWTEIGGYSARKSVLASGLFINSAPYAPIFGVSYPLVKDFWNLPEYAELLSIQMEDLKKAFSGEVSATEVLQDMAVRQQAVIDEAYPDGPPLPPMELVSIVTGVQVALLVLAGLLMLLVLVVMVVVYVKRAVAVFRFSSPIFMELILLGCLMLLGVLLTYAQDPPTAASCNFHLWLAVLGACLVLGPLLAKTWRVWQIYRNTAKFSSIRITNLDCLKVTAGVMVPVVILLAVWTGVDTNLPTDKYNEPNEGERTLVCDNQNLAIYLGVLFGYFGVLVAVGCALAFLTRNVATEFNESKFLAILIYNLVLVSAITIPLIFFISTDPTVSFALECAGILFAVLLVLAVLFGPKFYRLATGKGDERTGMTTRATISGRNNTTTTSSSSRGRNTSPQSDSDDIRNEVDTVVSGIFEEETE